MRATWTCIAVAEALALRVAIPWGAAVSLLLLAIRGDLRADVGASLAGLASLAGIAARRSGPPGSSDGP